MQKYVPFIMYCGNALLLFTLKLQCFERLLHTKSSDFTCVQEFRPVPPRVFEILEFKLKKNDNDNIYNIKNWRNGLFKISPMLMVQFIPKFR